MWDRPPAVAGRFYPADASKLADSLLVLADEIPNRHPERELIATQAVASPHAGYIFSGRFAVALYRMIKVPDLVFILCPNHTGRGRRVSVWPQGNWRMPGFDVPVDEEAAAIFLEECGEARPDREAHQSEHAVEVHLPLLRRYNPNIRIVPIVLAHLSFDACLEIAAALARSLERLQKNPPLLIASTDMSHSISAESAYAQDGFALRAMEKADARGLYRAVTQNQISMCGFIPTTIVWETARRQGASRAEVVAYGHSGERTGDVDSVVSYAAAYVV